MINEMFLITGWLFWIVVAVILLMDIGALAFNEGEMESAPQTWAIIFTTLGFLWAVTLTNAFSGARLEWLLGSVIVYFAVGVGWAFKKWIEFIKEKKACLLQRYKPEEITKKTPTAADNKARIVTWMYLWPLSVTWWVLTWPRRAFVWVYNKLATVFDDVVQRIWNS